MKAQAALRGDKYISEPWKVLDMGEAEYQRYQVAKLYIFRSDLEDVAPRDPGVDSLIVIARSV